MICSYCQSEIDNNLQHCPVCGAPVPPPADKAPDYFSQANEVPAQPAFIPQAPMINPLHTKTDMLVKDALFLVICILQTVATALPLINDVRSFNVLSILITVFLWVIFADSKKDLPNPSHIRLVSGTLFAYYVILYVLAGILALCGIICFFASSTIASLFTDAFSSQAIINSEFDRIFSLGGGVIGFAFLIVAAMIVLINYFSYGKIHKFVKSCYENIQSGVNALENRSATSAWLIIFAVFLGLGALGSISNSIITALAYGCQTAICILAYLLIKKNYYEYN